MFGAAFGGGGGSRPTATVGGGDAAAAAAAAPVVPVSYSAIAASGLVPSPSSSSSSAMTAGASHPGRVASYASSSSSSSLTDNMVVISLNDGGAAAGATSAAAAAAGIHRTSSAPSTSSSLSSSSSLSASSTPQQADWDNGEPLAVTWSRTAALVEVAENVRADVRRSVIEHLNAGELSMITLYTVPNQDIVPCTAANALLSNCTPEVAESFCMLCAHGESRIAYDPPHHIMPNTFAWVLRRWLRDKEGIDITLRWMELDKETLDGSSSSSKTRSRSFFPQMPVAAPAPVYAWVIHAVLGPSARAFNQTA